MFDWFKVKKYTKNKEMRVFVCKHCKLTCRDCDTTYCFSCFVNPKNPCPRCGKTNASFEENENETEQTT